MFNHRKCISCDINLKLFIVEIITNALGDKTLTALDERAFDIVEIMISSVSLQHVSDCRVVSVTDVKSPGVGGLVLSGV